MPYLSPSTSLSEATAENQRPDSGRILLIVDDEEGPRKSLRMVFKGDYQVLLAAGGREALEVARNHHIDAAVLDICMPEVSGLEVLEHLKDLDPAIEVVMLTAYETLETTRQSLRFGACDYLNKPFEIPAIRAAVQRAMRRRAVSDEIRNNNQILNRLKSELQEQQNLQEQLRSRGEIFASILHDMNSPLTCIIAYIEDLQDKISVTRALEGEALASVKDELAILNQQIVHCTEISRRYMRLLNEQPSENPSISANHIIKDLRHLLRIHPLAKGHEVRVEMLTSDVLVHIHGTELFQILMNLSNNALQCSERPHQVIVRSQVLNVPLDLEQFADGPGHVFINGQGLRNRPPLVAFSVSDNGPGIPHEILPKIFNPFFSTKKPGKGTGLGLSIIARLVKGCSGAAHAQSHPGEGARFTIFLPASIPYSTPVGGRSAPSSASW
jgi:signal transduction histidine kinase